MFHSAGKQMEEFFTVKEVAGMLKVHPNTIYRAIMKGYILAIRVGDKRRSPYRISKLIIENMHPHVNKFI